jgi:hypothetical protein
MMIPSQHRISESRVYKILPLHTAIVFCCMSLLVRISQILLLPLPSWRVGEVATCLSHDVDERDELTSHYHRITIALPPPHLRFLVIGDRRKNEHHATRQDSGVIIWYRVAGNRLLASQPTTGFRRKRIPAH